MSLELMERSTIFSGSRGAVPERPDDDDADDETTLNEWERTVHSYKRHMAPEEGHSSSPSSSASNLSSGPPPASSYIPRQLTFGQRIADRVTAIIGSWRFVITQSCCLFCWLILNVVILANPFDPYPFILLNLALSFQAAYSAPIIVMASNRSAEVDRSRASDLHEKVDHIRLQQMWAVWEKVIEMDGEHLKGRQVIGEMRDLLRDLSERMHSLERRIDHLARNTTSRRSADKNDRKDTV